MGSLVGRGIDHQLEALLGRWKLGNIVVWVSSTDVLLHGAISFLLWHWKDYS